MIKLLSEDEPTRELYNLSTETFDVVVEDFV